MTRALALLAALALGWALGRASRQPALSAHPLSAYLDYIDPPEPSDWAGDYGSVPADWRLRPGTYTTSALPLDWTVSERRN